MFRLLSGRFVHDMPSGQEAMIRAATCPAPALAQLCPELPELVCRLVDKALAFARHDRWLSAEAMRAAAADAYRLLHGEELTPSVLRAVASRIQISYPPDGTSDPCGPTALAPVASPRAMSPSPSAAASQGAYAKGLTGSGALPAPATLSFGGTWRFAAIAGFCLSVGVIVGIVAKRGSPEPLPTYPDAIREAAAPSPPPPPILLEPPAPPLASVAPTPSSLPAPLHPRPNASASPKLVSSPSPSASARRPAVPPNGPPAYDDFDHQ